MFLFCPSWMQGTTVKLFPAAVDCAGGFPYLIGGKYAEDYGLVEESCNPYTGNVSGHCTTDATCQRHYSTAYQYVGGYYGAYVFLLMIPVTC